MNTHQFTLYNFFHILATLFATRSSQKKLFVHGASLVRDMIFLNGLAKGA
jgi:hypothetical protein